jgi:hypothetical protein
MEPYSDDDSFEGFVQSKRPLGPLGLLRRWCDDDWASGTFGGKADSLFLLKQLQFNVPPFFALSSDFNGPNELHNALQWLVDNDEERLVAVRSSGLFGT